MQMMAEKFPSVRRIELEKNPAIFGRTIGDVTKDNGDRFVISRVLRNDELCVPSSDMILKEGDKLLIVTSPDAEDLVKILFFEVCYSGQNPFLFFARSRYQFILYFILVKERLVKVKMMICAYFNIVSFLLKEKCQSN